MRWGIETRLPFLDYRLVESAIGLPPERKLKDGMTKIIFRQISNEFLPDLIRNRHDKIGFETPADEFLRDPLLVEYCQRIIYSPNFEQRPFWDAKKIQAKYEAHLAGKNNIGDPIIKWISTELWMRAFIDPPDEFSPNLTRYLETYFDISGPWSVMTIDTLKQIAFIHDLTQQQDTAKISQYHPVSLRYGKRQGMNLTTHYDVPHIHPKYSMTWPDKSPFALCITHDVDEIFPPFRHTLLSLAQLRHPESHRYFRDWLAWKAGDW